MLEMCERMCILTSHSKLSWFLGVSYVVYIVPSAEQKHQHRCAAFFSRYSNISWIVFSCCNHGCCITAGCLLLLLQILLISGAFYFNCLHRMASQNLILTLTMRAKHGIPLKLLFILHIHALLPLKYFNIHGFFMQSPHQKATLLSTRIAQRSHNLKWKKLLTLCDVAGLKHIKRKFIGDSAMF